MVTDSTAPVPVAPEFGGSAPAYAPTEVTGGGGRIIGDIRIDGDPPIDTIIYAAIDPEICGTSFTDPTMRRSGDRIADVVVWLTDLRVGKAMPLQRRFAIAHNRCRLTPRVQAVLSGATLNVRSSDRTVHPARFLRAVDGSTIGVVTEHDAGQVVPDEAILAAPGRIEVRCDAHPWTRAWILAFDHPYFDVTDRRGGFELDSIPPGRYTLMAWHERLGTIEEDVVVEEGKATRIELEMKAR
jgi:hypothetical protein